MSQDKEHAMFPRDGEQAPAIPTWVQDVLDAEEIYNRTGASAHAGKAGIQDDDDIPLATKRGLILADADTNKAPRLAHDESSATAVPGDGGTAAVVNAQAANPTAGNTTLAFREFTGTPAAGATDNSGQASRRGTAIGGADAPNRTQDNAALERIYAAASLVRPRGFPSNMDSNDFNGSSISDDEATDYPVWRNAATRADMIARQYLGVQPRELETLPSADHLPYSGYTRSAGLTGPDNGNWSAYRIPSITVTDSDTNGNSAPESDGDKSGADAAGSDGHSNETQ